MSALEVLDGVFDLLKDPSRWVRGEPARDAAGRGVYARSPDAVCWCLVGALDRVAAFDAVAAVDAWMVLEAALAAREGAPARLSMFNDNHGHGEVLALLDEARALARKEGAA